MKLRESGGFAGRERRVAVLGAQPSLNFLPDGEGRPPELYRGLSNEPPGSVSVDLVLPLFLGLPRARRSSGRLEIRMFLCRRRVNRQPLNQRSRGHGLAVTPA